MSNLEEAPDPAGVDKATLWTMFLMGLTLDLLAGTILFDFWLTRKELLVQERHLDERIVLGRKDLAASREMQTLLQGLATDLLTLGKILPEVQRIVEKHQIRKTDKP